MTRVCCICKKVEHAGNWGYPDSKSGVERFSHGYCPACFSRVMREIDSFIVSRHPLVVHGRGEIYCHHPLLAAAK
ncbi:hypothetical protein [Desulfogranum mediterraneum]|uniref:hypothetical protein n=1 Tax=Desulfogranum mediterraneum TaxID=160661 RepID=UPI0004148051|nr:hypothetical protein [Desulfogranum mediterraneum]